MIHVYAMPIGTQVHPITRDVGIQCAIWTNDDRPHSQSTINTADSHHGVTLQPADLDTSFTTRVDSTDSESDQEAGDDGHPDSHL